LLRNTNNAFLWYTLTGFANWPRPMTYRDICDNVINDAILLVHNCALKLHKQYNNTSQSYYVLLQRPFANH